MFNLYKIRYSELKGESPVLGYELTAPIAVLGALLFILVLGITSPDFGFFMWRADITLPAAAALGLVVVLAFLAFIADDLGRSGLIILLAVSGVCFLALFPAALMLHDYYTYNSSTYPEQPPSTPVIGAAFGVYLVLVLWITQSRLRW